MIYIFGDSFGEHPSIYDRLYHYTWQILLSAEGIKNFCEGCL